MLGLEGLGDVFQEDQAEGDVLVFRWIQIAPQLVGGLEELGLEAEIAAAAGLRARHG
jgi:hypothetical protein